VGTYRIIQKLATGGMAEVFLGKVVGAEGFEKPVAVKRILPSYVQDSSFVELFLREAKLSVVLQHANVVQVLDLGSSNGQYYMVMEFVEGENLRTLLQAARARKISLGLREVCFIAQQVADGLAYAHSRTDPAGAPLNIIHRDVNPSNVMVASSGEIKLADFGIAKAADGHKETQAGVFKGKIHYLSPEQILSRPVDQRSDIFLLGLLLHELLAGKQLLEGTELQVVKQLGSFDERALEPLPGVPTPLWLTLTRALAASPESRFRTAREFSESLQNFLFDHRLRVGPSDIATLFSRVFPERRSPLEHLAKSAGEEIHLSDRDSRIRSFTPPGILPRRPPAPPPGPPPVLTPLPLPAAPASKPAPPAGAPLKPGEALPRPRAETVPHRTPSSPSLTVPLRGPRQARRLGELLLARGLLTHEKLEQALTLQRQTAGKLGQILLDHRMVAPDDLLRILSEQSGLPHITEEKLRTAPIPEELVRLVPLELCVKLCAVPVMLRARELYCAVQDPRDVVALDALKFAARAITVHGMFATASAIRAAIRRFYQLPEPDPAPLGSDAAAALDRERVLQFAERFTNQVGHMLEEEEEPEKPQPRPAPPLSVAPAPAPEAPARLQAVTQSDLRVRMVLVVAEAAELREAVVKLLLLHGIAAASSPTASAEQALALGGYDLVLLAEDASPAPAQVAERLRAAWPELGVRTFSSFSAALLGEGGPLVRLMNLNTRLLEGVLSMLGGSALRVPQLVRLTRRLAARLGAGVLEEHAAALATCTLLLAARLEEPRHLVLPSLTRARAVVGNDFPEVSSLLASALAGPEAGPPSGRAAQAVLGVMAFALQSQSTQPTATELAQTLGALRQNPRLSASVLEALITELGTLAPNAGSGPRVVVMDSDAATVMTLQLRFMAEGLGLVRARTPAEAEQALTGAQAAILESPLPDGDVHALVRKLRAIPATAHLPIFLVTSQEDVALATAGLEAGADDVLLRPLNMDMLLAKLRRALGQRQALARQPA
jgi:serine/threonine-protein kinase